MRYVFVATHITFGNSSGGYILFGRFPALLALAGVLTAKSKLWESLVQSMRKWRKSIRKKSRTNTMRTGIMSITLGSQLVALVAGPADSSTGWDYG